MNKINNQFRLILAFSFLFISAEAIADTALKLPKIKVTPIKEAESDRQYELYIKLPEDYIDGSEKQYPVIYFTDALHSEGSRSKLPTIKHCADNSNKRIGIANSRYSAPSDSLSFEGME